MRIQETLMKEEEQENVAAAREAAAVHASVCVMPVSV